MWHPLLDMIYITTTYCIVIQNKRVWGTCVKVQKGINYIIKSTYCPGVKAFPAIV